MVPQLLLSPLLPQVLKHLDGHPLLHYDICLVCYWEPKVRPSMLDLVSKHPRRGVKHTKRRITSLHLLVMPLPLEHQMLLAVTAASPRMAPVQLTCAAHLSSSPEQLP